MLQQTPPGTNVVVEAGVSEAAEATPLGFAVAEVRHLLPVRPPACAALEPYVAEPTASSTVHKPLETRHRSALHSLSRTKPVSARASLQVLPQAIVESEEEEEEEEEAAAPAPARPSPAKRAGQQVGCTAFPLVAQLRDPAPDDTPCALPPALGELHPTPCCELAGASALSFVQVAQAAEDATDGAEEAAESAAPAFDFKSLFGGRRPKEVSKHARPSIAHVVNAAVCLCAGTHARHAKHCI